MINFIVPNIFSLEVVEPFKTDTKVVFFFFWGINVLTILIDVVCLGCCGLKGPFLDVFCKVIFPTFIRFDVSVSWNTALNCLISDFLKAFGEFTTSICWRMILCAIETFALSYLLLEFESTVFACTFSRTYLFVSITFGMPKRLTIYVFSDD